MFTWPDTVVADLDQNGIPYQESVCVFAQVDEEEEGTCGLHYIPLKPSSGVNKTTSLKNTLLSSHLLSNGAIGDREEIAEGVYFAV